MNCESLVVDDVQLPISSDLDLVRAREQGRVLAGQLGFQQSDLTLVATAISELARNIVRYARRGEIVLRRAENGGVPGIVIIARDEGPGIPDLNRAMEPGYSTAGGLGLGLPGVRRVLDGLGHGEEAAAAANMAARVLQASENESVISMLKRCHEKLRSTRGVVVSLAAFNAVDENMTWVGVGNVEGILLQADPAGNPGYEYLTLRSGVVGTRLPMLHAAIVPVMR